MLHPLAEAAPKAQLEAGEGLEGDYGRPSCVRDSATVGRRVNAHHDCPPNSPSLGMELEAGKGPFYRRSCEMDQLRAGTYDSTTERLYHRKISRLRKYSNADSSKLFFAFALLHWICFDRLPFG
jgi:hypothetical protein